MDLGPVMIRCEQVEKKFGPVRALRGITLQVEKGEVLGLFGHNGAGKSTLLRILANLLRPTSGTVTLDGAPLEQGGDSLKKKIGVISHQPFLYDHLTAFENLLFFGKLYDVADPRGRAGFLLHELKLFSRRNDQVRNFSRGMVQRLTIARALIHEPSILFMDEPFTGLDLDGCQYVESLFRKLHEEGRTLVLATHDVSAGYRLGTRLAILKEGKVDLLEPVSAVPLEEFRRVFAEKVKRIPD